MKLKVKNEILENLLTETFSAVGSGSFSSLVDQDFHGTPHNLLYLISILSQKKSSVKVSEIAFRDRLSRGFDVV